MRRRKKNNNCRAMAFARTTVCEILGHTNTASTKKASAAGEVGERLVCRRALKKRD